jgi:transcriptional regulator with XRE-family HTH domain
MKDERSPTALDVTLGRRVRTRRLEVGMTQEKLAETLKVTFQQVQKYERGVNRIAASRLAAIADALNCPITYFYQGLCGDRTPSPASDVQDSLATVEGARLNALFATIKSRPIRQRILNLAAAVADKSA